jgi:GNAT superfamily N-acetyltransferase
VTEWISAWLTGAHDTGAFTCGVPALDEWLRREAERADRQDTARTYVWADEAHRVVAYYSVAPSQVRRDGLPRSASGGHSVVPAYLLARLALDRSLHGRGLGSYLLFDALEVILRAIEATSGRLVVVDAIDERAVEFYRHHGFQRVGGTNRLFLRAASLRGLA